MEESKKQSNASVSLWVTTAIVFIVVIVVLVLGFIGRGREAAKEQTYSRLDGFVSLWASELNKDISDAERFAGVIEEYIEVTKAGVKDAGLHAMMTSYCEDSVFSHVYLSMGDKLMDEKGTLHPDLKLPIPSEIEISFFLLDADENGNENIPVISVPVSESGTKVLFFLNAERCGKDLAQSGYEDLIFIAVFNREGDFVATLSGGKDTTSAFLDGENVLVSSQQGAASEDFTMFRTKYVNKMTANISCSYKGDERTLFSTPIGARGDWCVVMGMRQYYVDKMEDSAYEIVRSALLKFTIAVGLFALFIIGTVALNGIKNKERGRKLEDKADMDLLTELSNKAATERKIQEYMDANPNGHGLMFILDIDNFKKINDTMGHAFGDTLLRTLGRDIRTEFRVTDIIGRTGGDEFILFLKDINDEATVEREAARITRFFHDFKAGGDYVKYSATASIGAALYPQDAKNFKDLYVVADQALYRAKKRGKNQLVFYNEQKHNV